MKKTVKRTMVMLLCALISLCSILSSFSVYATENVESNPYLIADEIVVLAETLPEISSGPETTGNFEAYGLELSDIELLYGGPAAVSECDSVELSTSNEVCFLLKLADSSDMQQALAMLNQRSDVIAAEQNFIVEMDDAEYDPLATEQWHLDKIGVLNGWHSGVFSGSNQITVAVLDTGIAPHTDLENNIDVGNAYNAYLQNYDVADLHGHGTFIAGIIGADLDGEGINGICQEVNILPIKITNDTNNKSNLSTIMDAVDYAISKNADVINLSFSMPFYSDALIEKIAAYDGVFVTSAGNNGCLLWADIKNQCKINDVPNWIVVGASDENDESASFSNMDEIYVDLFAPGVSIYSTDIDGGYRSWNGTSFAAPQVAATCALIMANAPYLTPAEVRDLIMETTVPVAALEDYCVSGGRLSFYNAMDTLFTIERPIYSKGDVDGDGYITTTDYTLCKRIYMETVVPTEQMMYAADINGDGSIGVEDYIAIKRHVNKTYFVVA